MNMTNEQPCAEQYAPLVAQMKKKRRRRLFICVLVMIVGFVLMLPSEMTVLGEEIYQRDGAHPLVIVLWILVMLFAMLLVYASALTAADQAGMTECDPQKHLALNAAFRQGVDRQWADMVAYFTDGRFENVQALAESLLAAPQKKYTATALFFKACEMFIHYVKGRSAVALGEKNESIYRLRLVQESCPKTFMARSAAAILSELEPPDAPSAQGI